MRFPYECGHTARETKSRLHIVAGATYVRTHSTTASMTMKCYMTTVSVESSNTLSMAWRHQLCAIASRSRHWSAAPRAAYAQRICVADYTCGRVTIRAGAPAGPFGP